MRTYFRLSLVSADNNVCEPEPGNDFCEVGVLSQSQFSQSNPRATAWGICCKEHSSFILSWNMIGDREKKSLRHRYHFLARVCRRYFGRDMWRPEIHLRSQASTPLLNRFESHPLPSKGTNTVAPSVKHSDFSDPHNMGVGEGGGRGKMCRKK